jgi:A/G-specific adenine glycosylase
MKSNCDQDSQLSKQIVQWYIKNGRSNLPWRKNVTAYRVWISEIMLQQTQVKTVIPFFKKFINRYPTLKSLSSANEEEILALWTGLGFYRRAINIYNAKEIILNDFKNRFPKSFDDIVRLPGIGESTAGAIMSLAYQIPYPILDANVKRVISRYESVDNDSTHKSNKKLWGLSNGF